MAIDIESLRKQLAASEQELETAKSHIYRVDGAIQILRHLIAEVERPEATAAPVDTLDV